MIWYDACRFSQCGVWLNALIISREWRSSVMMRLTSMLSYIWPRSAAVSPSRPFFLCWRLYGYAGSTRVISFAPAWRTASMVTSRLITWSLTLMCSLFAPSLRVSSSWFSASWKMNTSLPRTQSSSSALNSPFAKYVKRVFTLTQAGGTCRPFRGRRDRLS